MYEATISLVIPIIVTLDTTTYVYIAIWHLYNTVSIKKYLAMYIFYMLYSYVVLHTIKTA